MQKNKKPLVTVCCPAYNHEKYIEQTVKSVVNQTYGFENIELIIIDDYSTDNTGRILEKLSRINNFKFIQNKNNKGVVTNLNKMYKLASGKYIAGIGSDDYWDNTKIEKQVAFMESLDSEYMVCHTDAWIIDRFGKKLFIHNSGKDYVGNIMPQILISNGIVAPSVMYRREIFEIVGYHDTTFKFEDRDMWIRIALKFKYANINEPLVYRRYHINNMCRDMNYVYETYSKIFKKHQILFKKYGLIEEYHYTQFYNMSASSITKSLFHLSKSSLLIFRIRTLYAFSKLFFPNQFVKSKFGLYIKGILKKW